MSSELLDVWTLKDTLSCLIYKSVIIIILCVCVSFVLISLVLFCPRTSSDDRNYRLLATSSSGPQAVALQGTIEHIDVMV